MFDFITEQFLAGVLVGLGCGYMIGCWLYGHLIDSAIEGRASMRRRDAASHSEPVKPASKPLLPYAPATALERGGKGPQRPDKTPNTPVEFGFEGQAATIRQRAKLPKDIPLPRSPTRPEETLNDSLKRHLEQRRPAGFDAAAPSPYKAALERRQNSERIPAEYMKRGPGRDEVNKKERDHGH